MNWNNLKSFKCPDCGKALKEHKETWNTPMTVYECTNFRGECKFKIGKEKFDKIVSQKYKPKKCITFEENLSALNNLGRKKMTEDFSDAPELDY